MRLSVRWGTATALAVAIVSAAHGLASAQNQCAAGTYAYTFTNYCAQAIFVGQNSQASTSTPPSFPEAGNWALAPACTVANQASVCTGPGSTCAQAGQQPGQCTCTKDSDCPGSAPCTSGLCSTTTTFCAPQGWSSAVFWPRTGCTLSGSTLTCTAGQCGGVPGVSGGQLDCGAGGTQVGPNPPVALFEATTSTASINYDVSLNSGYNAEITAVPVGGGYVFPLTTQPAACPSVGCVADLGPTCPVNLKGPAGCYDPCTRCTQSAPDGSAPNAQVYAALMCNQTIAKDYSGNTPVTTTACSGPSGGLPTYQDMYCAKNLEGDGNAQASVNQGTPTAFSQADCFPGTTFVIPTFPAGYAPPANQGVCLYESSTPGVNDYKWADAVNGQQNCADLADGSACGGYRTVQSDGGYYANALGYTCRTVTFQSQTAHLCLPPTTSGLGACTTDTKGGLPLDAAAGGTFNAAWLTAGLQAATAATAPPYTPGSTPYYQTFKTACPAAYTWQYDDAASGFACTVAPQGVTAFTGFNLSFCDPSPTLSQTEPELVGVSFLSAEARGAGGTLGRDRVEVSGYFSPTTPVDLRKETVRLDAALVERGTELVEGFGASQPLPIWLIPEPGASPERATFATLPGVTPRARMIIERKQVEGRHAFSLVLEQISIQRARACGPRPGPADKARLTTSFTLEGAAVAVSTDANWNCRDGVVYRVGQ
jgi:hypothetical protein